MKIHESVENRDSGTSPAVDGDSSDARLLDPLDQTHRLLQLEPVKNKKPVKYC